MPSEQDTGDKQTEARSGHPVGMKVLIAVNALAALVLLIMAPQYSGGRALLYLCAGLLHGVLAAGLFFDFGWASIVMIAYALFQVAGMSLWSLIGIMTLAIEPLSQAKAQFLILAAAAIPFLAWSAMYLLRHVRNRPASKPD
ncbi:MAG: hypothetical protein PVH25_04600 [Burkholderiales bacterium]|jgi:hypothetical protein